MAKEIRNGFTSLVLRFGRSWNGDRRQRRRRSRAAEIVHLAEARRRNHRPARQQAQPQDGREYWHRIVDRRPPQSP